MTDLKRGWRRVKFGEVVRLNKETCKAPAEEGIERVIGLEHLEPGDHRVRAWASVADGTTFTNRVRPGQVLFGKRRAYQRKVAIADFDAICSGDIYVFESPDPTRLLPELLPFVCQTDAFFDHAVGTSAGSLSPRTNWSSLAQYEFALPPLAEQRRIAEVLVGWTGQVDGVRRVREAGGNLLSSLRNDHFRRLGPEVLRPLSTAVLSSAYGPRFSGDNYDLDGNVRTIRTTDMPDFGVLTLATAPGAIVPPDIAAEHRLRDGDFLISRTGFTSGRAAVFREAESATVFIPAAFLVRLRLASEILEPEYLLEYIQSVAGRTMIRMLQRGTQQLNISASALVARSVPIPDRTHQRETIDQLAVVHNAIAAANRRLAETTEAMRLVAQRALQGEHELH